LPEDTSEHTALIAAATAAGDNSSTPQRTDLVLRAAKIEALEADIGRLSTHWQDVERHLKEKEALIGSLQQTVATLQHSLAQSEALQHQLSTQLADRATRIEQLTASHGRLHREAQAHRAEIERLQGQLATAQAETVAVQQQLVARPPQGATSSEVQDLLEERAALTAYIEGRRASWDAARATQTSLATKIVALEHSLATMARQLRDAETLAARESERATTLRAELVVQARRVEALERELRAARQNGTRPATPAPEPLAPGPAAAPALEPVAPAPAVAAPAGAQAASNDTADTAAPGLAPAFEAIAQLEAEVEYKRQQVAAQVVELHHREQRLRTSSVELDRFRHELIAARSEIEHSRADAARLERAILEKDRALDARDARIATLQQELDQRLVALQKLNAIDVSLQGLDSRMAERLRGTEAITGAAVTPALICLTGDAPQRFQLTKRVMTIGRGPQCDLQIMTHFVSREHARISFSGRSAVIEDLGSRNGVFVNSVRVDRHELQQGDLITIGETQFRYIESMAH
jgi:chromosome segregation ATPase